MMGKVLYLCQRIHLNCVVVETAMSIIRLKIIGAWLSVTAKRVIASSLFLIPSM